MPGHPMDRPLDRPLTLGVEEEYLLLDPETLRPAHVADAVLETAARPSRAVPDAPDGAELQHELLRSQVEVATGVCTTLDEAAAELRDLRRTLGAAAAEHGVRLVATGAAPLLPADGAGEVSDGPRYRGLHALAPALVAEQLICGMHVHVGVADRDAAVEVVNRLRPDLPALTALAANSPFWAGRDTGFASWRTVHWERWPVQGPPPLLGDAAGDGLADRWDERLGRLVATGAARDRKQVYWDARLSDHLPTVEVRCADVQLAVDDAVLLAGLVRALVATALDDVAAGAAREPAVATEPDVLAAATWVAARNGLRGSVFDVRTGGRRPAVEVVADLVGRCRPALVAAGDDMAVAALVDRAVTLGTGADRQREALARTGSDGLLDVLAADRAQAGTG